MKFKNKKIKKLILRRNEKMRKVTRNEINKNNMVALGYCQCQTILNLFGYDYKIGYNSGIYGWNYDMYRIRGFDIITGYNVPYKQYSNKEIKNKLVLLEYKVSLDNSIDKSNFKKEFLKIFE